MNYLCDTNILSEMMRRSPDPLVEQWFQAQAIISLSVITVEEIDCGLAYKQAPRQREWFQKFLALRGKILPVTEAIARQSGLWRGSFRQQGIIRTQADLLIAATAKVHQLVLVTRNTPDFEQCELQLSNPFKSVT